MVTTPCFDQCDYWLLAAKSGDTWYQLTRSIILNKSIFFSLILIGCYACLNRQFLSRQLNAIFVALKLHQVSTMFENPAILRRQIALKIATGLQVRFCKPDRFHAAMHLFSKKSQKTLKCSKNISDTPA